MIRRGQCGRSGRGETRGLRGRFVQKGGEERRYSSPSPSTPCAVSVKGPCIAEFRDELGDSGAGHDADKGLESTVVVGGGDSGGGGVRGCACQRVLCGTGDLSACCEWASLADRETDRQTETGQTEVVGTTWTRQAKHCCKTRARWDEMPGRISYAMQRTLHININTTTTICNTGAQNDQGATSFLLLSISYIHSIPSVPITLLAPDIAL